MALMGPSLHSVPFPGGIDTNCALGPHTHQNQHKIAFPGGIGPGMVWLAWEYCATQIKQYWVNNNFNYMVNPPGHHPPPPVEDRVRDITHSKNPKPKSSQSRP